MTNEELCILAQSGNADAESELIDHLLPSLKALAAKFEAQYSGLQIEADDLLQEGSIGLLRAVYSFRPEKGYLFQTFASRVSENAMMDYVRKCVSAIPTTGHITIRTMMRAVFTTGFFQSTQRHRNRFISKKKHMKKSIMLWI